MKRVELMTEEVNKTTSWYRKESNIAPPTLTRTRHYTTVRNDEEAKLYSRISTALRMSCGSSSSTTVRVPMVYHPAAARHRKALLPPPAVGYPVRQSVLQFLAEVNGKVSLNRREFTRVVEQALGGLRQVERPTLSL